MRGCHAVVDGQVEIDPMVTVVFVRCFVSVRTLQCCPVDLSRPRKTPLQKSLDSGTGCEPICCHTRISHSSPLPAPACVQSDVVAAHDPWSLLART